jgi:hypothetical protein
VGFSDSAKWQAMMSRCRLIVQRIASLASRLRFGVRRSSSVFVAGARPVVVVRQ